MAEGETVQVEWKSKITGASGRGEKIPVGADTVTPEGVKTLKQSLDKLQPDVEHTVKLRKPVGKRSRHIDEVIINPQ